MRSPIADTHSALKILKLKDRKDLHLSMDCHKSIYKRNSSLLKYFKPKVTRVTREGDTRTGMPDIKTTMGRTAFSYRGPEHWDKFPQNLKTTTSRDSFKSEYLKTLFRDENHPTYK